MASVLLYLGILFTITVPEISAKGPLSARASGPVDDGEISSLLRLVPAPLRVVIQRKTQVLLDCSIVITQEKLLPLSFSWLKDGKEIEIDSSKPRPRAQLFSNGSLLLRPRRKKSKGGRNRKLDGLYSCIVTTSWGSLIARRVEVVVASIEKNFTREPVSQEVFEGSVARFECTIRAKPKPLYVWNRNNDVLPTDDPRISILPFGVIQIRNVSKSDAGQYWCQATPDFGSSLYKVTDLRWSPSRAAQLKVLPGAGSRPLRIVAPPQNVNMVVGETAYLECLADAWPSPSVSWKVYRGDTVLPGHQTTNLVITNVMPEHGGIYECTASSGGKTVSANATLSVNVPPRVKEKHQNHIYAMSRTFNLVCEVEGNPKPTISWYHNGIPFSDRLNYELKKEGNLQRMIFFNSILGNSGFYQCVANNSAGEAMSVSFIWIEILHNPPPIPEDVSAEAKSSTTVLLRWTWPFEIEAKHYIIGLKDLSKEAGAYHSVLCRDHRTSGHHHSCHLDNLYPYTTYSFYVQAFVKSPGEMSEKVKVTTWEDVPKALPALKVSFPHPYEMNVSWTPLPADRSRGKVTKYRLIYRKHGNDETEKEVFLPALQTSYLVQGVEPSTTYDILVVARTSAGFNVLDPTDMPWKKHTTPKLTGMMSPRFKFIFVNLTSVMLEWHSAGSDVTGYIVKYWPVGREMEEEVKEELPSNSTSHLLHGLDEDEAYEVTLIAHMMGEMASPTTKLLHVSELRQKLVPADLRQILVTSDSITIGWSPVPFKDLQYEVCVGQVDKDKTCYVSDTNSFKMTGAKSVTSYEFEVRVLIQDWKGKFSDVKKIETKAGLPSPPVNLTVGLLSKGTVMLRWQQPSQPNGDIVAYIIQYGKGFSDGEIKWKSITVTGGANTLEISKLTPEEYSFKLRAETSAGFGNYTPIKTFVPVCDDDVNKCNVLPLPINPVLPPRPDERLEKTTRVSLSTAEIIAICAGVLVIMLLIIVIVFFCRRRCLKNRDLDPNTSHAPIYSANGHIPTVYTHTGNNGNHRPINGHAYPVRQTNVDTSSHEFMPMIQIDEDDLPDSKGESDTFAIPNGLRMNGFVKNYNYYNNRHPVLTPITRLHGDSNSEEMRGLMSGDGSHTTLIMSSSLDDMDGTGGGVGDGGLHQRGEDHSSEDSGTGSSRAPCAQFVGSRSNSNSQGLASPASSPGSCSSHDVSSNTLPRPCHNHHHHHHHHLRDGHSLEMADGFRRLGDEVGGVRIDPSTGSVIGVMESPQHHQYNPHNLQAQQESSLPLSEAGDQLAGKHAKEISMKGNDRDGCSGQWNECDKHDEDLVHWDGDKDSGHGSELKMSHNLSTTTNAASGDFDSRSDDPDDHVADYLNSYPTSSSTTHSHNTGGNNSNGYNNFDNDNVSVVSPGDSQQLSLPQPPPPPPPPPLSLLSTITSSSSSSSPSSSSQQLPSVTPMSTSSPSSSSRWVSNSLVDSATSECDELPLPPLPPLPVATATPAPAPQAADDQGSSSTTPQGQLVGSHDGVVFSSSPSSSSTPPHENGSGSKRWNLPPNIA